MEKLTVRGSINLNLGYSGAKQNVLCKKKIKEKCATFCFVKLNANLSFYLHTLLPAEAAAMK